MNFLAHTTPFVCSQIRLTALSLCECKSVICSVLRRVYVGKIYSLISKILKFDWLMQATWKWRTFVNQIRLSKRFVNRFIWANDSRFSIFAGTANESWQILQLVSFLVSVGAGGLFSRRLLLYYLSHYLQLLAQVLQNRCLKNFAQFAEKYLCRSLSLISQQPALF